ncbi:hypothetical protein Glove_130g127 [Diversispora epigaea]|uniref:Uncharacterized protein n=1 Tax=Diversispora epigaea TaxID=1348612 RepID=A0A397J805_9GLOM|nr:hypothetical protein Glove_130g127 [Diversispora epigaea]
MTLQLQIIDYIFETTPNRLNSTLFDNRSINRIIQQRPFSRFRRLRAVDILFYNIQFIIINSNLSIVHNYNQFIINSALRHAADIIWRRLTPQERNRYVLLNQNINQNIINHNTNNNIRYQPHVRNPNTTINQNSGNTINSTIDLQPTVATVATVDLNSGLNWDSDDNDDNDDIDNNDVINGISFFG